MIAGKSVVRVRLFQFFLLPTALPALVLFLGPGRANAQSFLDLQTSGSGSVAASGYYFEGHADPQASESNSFTGVNQSIEIGKGQTDMSASDSFTQTPTELSLQVSDNGTFPNPFGSNGEWIPTGSASATMTVSFQVPVAVTAALSLQSDGPFSTSMSLSQNSDDAQFMGALGAETVVSYDDFDGDNLATLPPLTLTSGVEYTATLTCSCEVATFGSSPALNNSNSASLDLTLANALPEPATMTGLLTVASLALLRRQRRGMVR